MIKDIVIDDNLRSAIEKLYNCQDSQTGLQVFYGQIRIDIVEGIAQISIDDPIFETENNKFDVRSLRKP